MGAKLPVWQQLKVIYEKQALEARFPVDAGI
jgi:hypothetical protein